MAEARIIAERRPDQPQALYLTISNPDSYNAFTVEMRQEIVKQLENAEKDKTIKVIILQGEGDKCFSSGLSMEMLDNVRTTDDRIEQWKIGKDVRDALTNSNKIIVSAVKGSCAGAGLEFTLCCDLVYCADNAKFVLPEFNIGLTPGCGGALSLHKRIPYNRFMEMVIFCDRMRAEEAHRLGFVNKVFPLAEFDTELHKLVDILCTRPPLAVKGLKEQLRIQHTLGDEAALRKEFDLAINLMSTNDFKNAVKAFRNKQPPVFNGD